MLGEALTILGSGMAGGFKAKAEHDKAAIVQAAMAQREKNLAALKALQSQEKRQYDAGLLSEKREYESGLLSEKRQHEADTLKEERGYKAGLLSEKREYESIDKKRSLSTSEQKYADEQNIRGTVAALSASGIPTMEVSTGVFEVVIPCTEKGIPDKDVMKIFSSTEHHVGKDVFKTKNKWGSDLDEYGKKLVFTAGRRSEESEQKSRGQFDELLNKISSIPTEKIKTKKIQKQEPLLSSSQPEQTTQTTQTEKDDYKTKPYKYTDYKPIIDTASFKKAAQVVMEKGRQTGDWLGAAEQYVFDMNLAGGQVVVDLLVFLAKKAWESQGKARKDAFGG